MQMESDQAQDSISRFFEHDHREIDAILDGIRFDSPKEAVTSFEEFDRRLERHIHWEEGILFPAVGRKAPQLEFGPIRIMKEEHEDIRKHKAAALEALRRQDGKSAESHADEMIRVLTGHNVKEERVLYPACDELLSKDETREIFEQIRTLGYPASSQAPGR